jgi:small subunit ribosomal protein S8
VAQVLKDEGFVLDYQVGRFNTDEHGHPTFQEDRDLSKPKAVLRVFLKYGPDDEQVIRRIDRASKPGRRLYRGYKELRPVLGGMGIQILSTPRGIISDRRARTEKVGGEVLALIH